MWSDNSSADPAGAERHRQVRSVPEPGLEPAPGPFDDMLYSRDYSMFASPVLRPGRSGVARVSYPNVKRTVPVLSEPCRGGLTFGRLLWPSRAPPGPHRPYVPENAPTPECVVSGNPLAHNKS